TKTLLLVFVHLLGTGEGFSTNLLVLDGRCLSRRFLSLRDCLSTGLHCFFDPREVRWWIHGFTDFRNLMQDGLNHLQSRSDEMPDKASMRSDALGLEFVDDLDGPPLRRVRSLSCTR